MRNNKFRVRRKMLAVVVSQILSAGVAASVAVAATISVDSTNQQSAITIDECTLGAAIMAANAADWTLENFWGEGTITKSNISNNHGGGIVNGGKLAIFDSTISFNKSGTIGGGIYNTRNAHSLTLVNSTVSANTSFIGAGLVSSSFASLFNVTITGNSAAIGAGIHHRQDTLSLQNTIVFDNHEGTDCYSRQEDAVLSLGGNLVGTQGAGSNRCADFELEGIFPELGPLDNNGGPIQTHALLEGSSAINAGVDCSGEPVNGLDQRGFPRDANCDIGAYEFAAERILIDGFD